MGQIKPGMTFSEISKLIPLEDSHRITVRQHGGAFFDVPMSSKYVIQLRFEHPKNGTALNDTKINHSPRLRDRLTSQFIQGKEEAW